MISYLIIIIILLLVVAPISSDCTQDKEVFLREDFNNLEDWKPLHFPKIKKHTQYSIERKGEGSYLKAESNSSASGIVFQEEFNVFEYPKVRWRWKVSNIFKRGNAKKKSGDDYPLRVYIIFKYNPDKSSFWQKIKYGFAKKIYGEYPLHSSLNYIWLNRQHEGNILTNTYAKEAKMIPLQTGEENAGMWMDQEIDIIEDYHKAFGKDPPVIGSLAIMSDSDNTGESVVSYIDYIEVYR